MIILGLNAFHADSSAALVRDGKLIAAAEEERFRRIKHWAGFPSQAISYCLNEAGIKLSDVEHIAFNQDSRANLLRKITYFLTKRPNINLVLRRLRNRRSRAGIPALLEQTFSGETIRAAIHPVEHHLAHLSSAFHVCPFDQAAVVSVDGFGDFSSAAWGVAAGSDISSYGIFRIRSASSTKPLHNTSAFPIMVTNTRSWAWRPMVAPHVSRACGKLCVCSQTAGSSSIWNSSAIIARTSRISG
jgi:predicted NodU family carbamoyl transferase